MEPELRAQLEAIIITKETLISELQTQIRDEKIKTMELDTVIGGFWEALYNSYNVESREEIEKDTREIWAKGTSPLLVALHFVWKREPRVAKLIDALEKIASAKYVPGSDMRKVIKLHMSIADKVLANHKKK